MRRAVDFLQQKLNIHVNIDQLEQSRFWQILNIVYIYGIMLMQICYVFIAKFFSFGVQFIRGERSVDGEVVLITGSAGYLGRSLAFEFAKRGAILVLWDINETENKKTCESLKSVGKAEIHMFTVDLTKEEHVRKTAKLVLNTIGTVSVLVMAAAPPFSPKSVLDLKYKEDIEKHFILSYMSQLWLMQELAGPMIEKNLGNIATVSSLTAILDTPLVSPYASFKSAQSKLIQTLREELVASKITGVNTTVVYLSILKGGLANGFNEAFEFHEKLSVTGEEAAKKIASGILKSRSVIFVPRNTRFLPCFKYLITPRLNGFISSKLVKYNSKYLISSSSKDKIY